ncbi:MAG TPA: hypothetical protein VN643_13640 [Pyrinomonadaceae bacterium]|nr:hypothetical protein [Pyrinomonadaceae bacterium]
MLTLALLLSSQLLLLQNDGSDFKDLGKYLVIGFVLAVGAGVTFTVVRLRLRDRKPQTGQVISITSKDE